MASVLLSSDSLVDDFLAPGQACVNPLYSEPPKPAAVPRRRARVTLQMEDDAPAAVVASAPDLIRSAPATDAGGGEAKATLSLSDCLACSGCVTSAEAVLVTQQGRSQLVEAIARADKDIVVSLSPQAIASFAAHFGTSMESAFGRLSTFLNAQGVGRVFQTASATDFALLETSAEFVRRCVAHAQEAGGRRGAQSPSSRKFYPPRARRFRARAATPECDGGAAVATAGAVLPMLTSACPGWICYAEKTSPYVLPHVSTSKSAQQVMGTLVKFLHGEEPSRLYHVTVMPCFDKKLEASRQDFFHTDANAHEVDLVLSTAEMLEWINESGSAGMAASVQDDQGGAVMRADDDAARGDSRTGSPSFMALSESPRLDPPGSLEHALSGLADDGTSLMSVSSMGGSGGFLEHTFRHAAMELFGEDLSTSPLPYRRGRNADFAEVALERDVNGHREVLLRFALVYGFRNIQTIVNKIKRGKCPYDFIEIMACPSGCVNGGGQIKDPGESPAASRERVARTNDIFHARTVRHPHDSPLVHETYRCARAQRASPVLTAAAVRERALPLPHAHRAHLGTVPGSAQALAALHTSYHEVPKLGSSHRW